MHSLNDNIETCQNIHIGDVLLICESTNPMDQTLLDSDIEDPNRLSLTLEDCFPLGDCEELLTATTTNARTEATGIHPPDTGGCFATSQYVETFENYDLLEASSSSSMVCSSHRSVQPLSTFYDLQAPGYFQQIENLPFFKEGYLEFVVPNMATPVLHMDMAAVENSARSFWPIAGIPQDIFGNPRQDHSILSTQPISLSLENQPFDLLSAPQDIFGYPRQDHSILSTQPISLSLENQPFDWLSAPQDIFGHPRQDHSILSTQPISLSLDNQTFELLSAPQDLVVNPLPQSLSHTPNSLGVPFADQPWNYSIPASYDINHRDFSSTALTQTHTHGSRFLEIRSAKRRNVKDLSSPDKALKRPRKPECKKGSSSVPASHIHTFSTGKTRKEPRKKTNNSCLNCMLNHKGVRNCSF
jgi:hypothetical protein